MAEKKTGKASAAHKSVASNAAPPSPPPPPHRPAMQRPRGHGRVERGLDAVARKPEGFGRFGRMFPELAPARFGTTQHHAQQLMFAISETMLKKDDGAPIDKPEPVDENPDIFAGYTYFGQFIDHDITFDTASDLDRDNDPGGVADFRTARLDLDSVYGRGPTDQPYLYNPDFTIKLGADKTPDYLKGAPNNKKRFDVQRAPLDRDAMESKDPTDCRRAVIGDPRNDENNIVVQIHSLWQRLHNKIMAQLALPTDEAGNAREGITGEGAFNTAQRQVRWHYQWVVLHDFLKRVVGQKMFDAVYNDGEPVLKFYKPGDASYPFMPVEFSVAAYRFGHSMVRPSYSLSAMIPHMVKDPKLPLADRLKRLSIFTANFKCKDTGSLNGFRPLHDAWGIDWSFFLPGLDSTLPPDEESGLKFSTFKRPQPAYRMDTLLVDPLGNLPDHRGEKPERRSLPSLNLLRGLALGLPSGQAVARRMGLTPLTDAKLWLDKGNLVTEPDMLAARGKLFHDHKPDLHENAPLWYYILREAELTKVVPTPFKDDQGKPQTPVPLGGNHLGEVGGRIVAEVLIGLVLADDQSYLVQSPEWKPTLRITSDGKSPTPKTPKIGAKLTLTDIVRYVDQRT